MSVNSSSSSLPPSSINLYYVMQSCIESTAGTINMIAFAVTNILLLPLYIHVIYLGLQRWRRQRSDATMSHSDIFTYHMVAIELMGVVGSTLNCCAALTHLPVLIMLGLYLFSINITGQELFHILTCVERYLAVVHPITYLSLRNAKGIRIRNITIGCVWLMCFADIGLLSIEDSTTLNILIYCLVALMLILVSFCSLSVLWVLIRPGPGEGGGGGGRQRVDQSKLRAFYTIMSILGVLLLRYGGYEVGLAMYASTKVGEMEWCISKLSVTWFGLPSSLVLPLLFLHRAGRLPCCRKNNELGR